MYIIHLGCTHGTYYNILFHRVRIACVYKLKTILYRAKSQIVYSFHYNTITF